MFVKVRRVKTIPFVKIWSWWLKRQVAKILKAWKEKWPQMNATISSNWLRQQVRQSTLHCLNYEHKPWQVHTGSLTRFPVIAKQRFLQKWRTSYEECKSVRALHLHPSILYLYHPQLHSVFAWSIFPSPWLRTSLMFFIRRWYNLSVDRWEWTTTITSLNYTCFLFSIFCTPVLASRYRLCWSILTDETYR